MARRRCGIVARNSTDYVRQAFAQMNAGDVVVPIRREDDYERIDIAGVEWIVVPEDEGGWVDSLDYVKSSSHDVAQVLFTSGTEGKPKAVVLSHAQLANTTDRLISIMELDRSVREYLGVPIYYSFGFARARTVSEVGGALYIPPNGFDPIEIAEMLGSGLINALSAVPSLFRLLLQNDDLFAGCGDKMRWIEIGSQYMSRAEKEHLKKVFPKAAIVQHYGLTEASRSTFLKVHEVEGPQLESVGKSYDGIEVDINAERRIRIRGPNIASGTIHGESIVSLTDSDGWFTSNDLGHIDDGFLYYDGRADDVINSGGLKLAPEQVEQAICAELQTDSGVRVSRIPDPIRGDAILVAYLKPMDIAEVKLATNKALGGLGLVAGTSTKYLACSSFPVTETGKIQRHLLASQYEEHPDHGETANESTPAPESDQMRALAEIWEEVLQIESVGEHDNFFDLGGDSLSAISVAIRMERVGIPKRVARQIFEGKTISEIVQGSHEDSGRTPLANGNLAITAVRGALVLCVIGAHWMPAVIERMPSLESYNRLLSSFYSAGTPGFAMVFGIGVGFAYLPLFQRSTASVKKLVYRNALLLFVGILAIGLTRIAAELADGNSLRPVDISNSFYGVLTYYFLAVLSIPIWLRFLLRQKDLWIACLSVSAAMYGIHLAVEANNPNPSDNPFVQTIILLATSAYNYFEMTAGAMVGIAVGSWYRETIVEGRQSSKMLLAGLLMTSLGLLMSADQQQLHALLEWPKPLALWIWVFYAGIAMTATHLVFLAAQRVGSAAAADNFLKLMCIIGILAFPLFILHELAVPLKRLLVSFGIPGALFITVLAFFLIAAFLVTRLFRAYFPSDQAQAL